MFGFSVDEFETFLVNLGQAATWETATLCPDRNLRTGGANVACPVCRGTGYVWGASQVVTIGITGLQTEEEYAMPSEWERGDVIATLGSDSPAYAAGEYDRFTLTNVALRFAHVLTRGTNDTLKYRTPVAITDLWAIVGSPGVKTDLVQGTDYTLSGNVITWITNTVAVGQNYSVTYTARPEYFVYRDLLQDRPHEGGLTLPRRAQLRLMDLFGRAVRT